MIETISCGMSFWPSFSKELTSSRIRKGNRWLRQRCPWNSWCLLSFHENTELCWSDISCFEVLVGLAMMKNQFFIIYAGFWTRKSNYWSFLLYLSFVNAFLSQLLGSATPFSIVFNQWHSLIIKIFDDTCWYLHIFAYMCLYVLICAYMCIYVLICAYVCLYALICAYMRLYVLIYAYFWRLSLASITMLDYFDL